MFVLISRGVGLQIGSRDAQIGVAVEDGRLTLQAVGGEANKRENAAKSGQNRPQWGAAVSDCHPTRRPA